MIHHIENCCLFVFCSNNHLHFSPISLFRFLHLTLTEVFPSMVFSLPHFCCIFALRYPYRQRPDSEAAWTQLKPDNADARSTETTHTNVGGARHLDNLR